MADASTAGRSFWMDVSVAPGCPQLHENLTTDVLIVGSGIAGLSTAYELTRGGLDVIVVDSGPVAGGMTALTTAHLSPICDDTLKALVAKRGVAAARHFQASHQAAVVRIEHIQAEHLIACDLRRLDGILFLAEASEPAMLDNEVKAAKQIGIAVERGAGLPLRGLDARPYLRYPQQATFHPTKYLAHLAELIIAAGGRIFANSPVAAVAEAEKEVSARLAGGETIVAKYAVLATNGPVDGGGAPSAGEARFTTYAIALEAASGLVPDALYWDTATPYHYVRLATIGDGKTVLIAGGEDRETGSPDDGDVRFERLETWVRNLLPDLGDVTHQWSGEVVETGDYGAFIGLEPGRERTFVVSGDSGQGITHGVIASLIIPQLIAGQAETWFDVYAPGRAVAGRPAPSSTTGQGKAR
jgi:glycine/D-amino acid oxidase-like deaminating enzyme